MLEGCATGKAVMYLGLCVCADMMNEWVWEPERVQGRTRAEGEGRREGECKKEGGREQERREGERESIECGGVDKRGRENEGGES